MSWQGCDYVIALTHMRNPNDVKLAENVDEIDLILGGHDHVYEVNQVSKCRIVFTECFSKAWRVIPVTKIEY